MYFEVLKTFLHTNKYHHCEIHLEFNETLFVPTIKFRTFFALKKHHLSKGTSKSFRNFVSMYFTVLKTIFHTNRYQNSEIHLDFDETLFVPMIKFCTFFARKKHHLSKGTSKAYRNLV